MTSIFTQIVDVLTKFTGEDVEAKHDFLICWASCSLRPFHRRRKSCETLKEWFCSRVSVEAEFQLAVHKKIHIHLMIKMEQTRTSLYTNKFV